MSVAGMLVDLRCFGFLPLALLIAACDPPPPTPPSDVGPRDVGARDVPSPSDVPLGDAPLEDGAVPDAGTGMCTTNTVEVLPVASDLRMRDRVVGLAAGASGWALAWHQSVVGLDEIFVASVGATGTPDVRQVTTLNALQRDPSIVATPDGWLLAWSGNHLDANYEVYAQSVGLDLTPVGMPSRLTMHAGLDGSTTLIALPTGSFLAGWVESGANNLAVTRVLSAAGAPTGASMPVTTATNDVARPTLAPRSAGAVLVWGHAGTMPSAEVLALDAVGGPSGAPTRLSTEGNADGSSDIAMDDEGGAAVFGALVGGARAEVRVRLLDATGTPIESERVATPSSGRDASIAAFAGGYAVSYRSASTPPMIRLALLDAQGVFQSESDLADAESTGGRTTVRVTTDGRILVAWADTNADGTRIRAARVQCE